MNSIHLMIWWIFGPVASKNDIEVWLRRFAFWLALNKQTKWWAARKGAFKYLLKFSLIWVWERIHSGEVRGGRCLYITGQMEWNGQVQHYSRKQTCKPSNRVILKSTWICHTCQKGSVATCSCGSSYRFIIWQNSVQSTFSEPMVPVPALTPSMSQCCSYPCSYACLAVITLAAWFLHKRLWREGGDPGSSLWEDLSYGAPLSCPHSCYCCLWPQPLGLSTKRGGFMIWEWLWDKNHSREGAAWRDIVIFEARPCGFQGEIKQAPQIDQVGIQDDVYWLSA